MLTMSSGNELSITEWRERALRWEKESMKYLEESSRLKADLDDLRARFDSLVEASLQQMTRLDEYTPPPGGGGVYPLSLSLTLPHSLTTTLSPSLPPLSTPPLTTEKAKRLSPTTSNNTPNNDFSNNEQGSNNHSSNNSITNGNTSSPSATNYDDSHSAINNNGNSGNNEKRGGTPNKKDNNKKFPLFIKTFSHILPGNDKEPKRKEKKEKDKGMYALDEDVRTDFVLPLAPSTSYQHLPRLQVCPLTSKRNHVIISGPTAAVGPVLDDDSGTASYSDIVAGRSVSTYPHIPGLPNRDGDPIADRFAVHVYENRVIACMADGCAWGDKPREAAVKANSAFIEYVNAAHESITDVKKAGAVLLNAFEYAHNAIMEGKMQFWEAGTTTLLGGVLLEINKGSDKWTPQWEFVCASVGDCKAFMYASNGEITDITHGNRLNASDPRDCGGRLGPHLDEGKPDLRNLNLFCASCEDGDLIIVVTDGVHDNLDPQHLGRLPKDMPKEFNLVGEKWDDVDPAKAIFAKNAYVTELLQSMLKVSEDEAPSPKEVTTRLVNHCIEVTNKSRTAMENSQGKRLPEDYVEFPGKMDHTSCLCFRVGRFPNLPEKGHHITPGSQVQVPSLSMSSSSFFLTSSSAPDSPPHVAASMAVSSSPQVTRTTADENLLLNSPHRNISANNFAIKSNENWTKISPSIRHS